LQLRSPRVNELELGKLCVEDADDLGQRIIGLAGLAESLRSVVDFLNHLRKVLVKLIEAVLKLLGKLVAMWLLVLGLCNDASLVTYVLSRS